MAFRRSTFLINKRFQLRFSLYVCSWLVVLCLAYPMIISNLFDHFIRYLTLDPRGPELGSLAKTRESLIWLLILMQVILINLTFLISIFMSHRIAGPLYKLWTFFQGAKAGNLEEKLFFRKSDYFQELAMSYNEMMDSIRLKIDKKTSGVKTAIPLIEKALSKADQETRTELETALAALRESQKS